MPQKSLLSIKERIESRISINERGCWIWTGATNNKGYGRININRVLCYPHRLMYEIFFGPIPDGLKVLHDCDTPPCCNPGHLFLGTTKDNAQDARSKGRLKIVHHVGEKHGMAKLTDEAVRDILSSDSTLKIMAEKYGVSIALIGYVRAGKIWKHVTSGTCSKRN